MTGLGIAGFGSCLTFPFLQSPYGRSGNFKPDLLASDHDGHRLKVGLPDFTGLFLGKRYAVAELFSFTANFAGIGHDGNP